MSELPRKPRTASPTLSPLSGAQTTAPWKNQEKRAAKAISGRNTRGSGCGRDKGDAKSDLFLVECKSTQKESLSIKRAWLEKITREAGSKIPALYFGFDRGAGDVGLDWVAFPAKEFKGIQDILSAVIAGDLDTATDLAEAYR